MLSKDQFLPGMAYASASRPAEPHEQTEAQFHNRPDVYVHGRFQHKASDRVLDLHRDNHEQKQGFHAGTEQSAHERLESLGAPWEGHEARFYHGRVDPIHMQNTPEVGRWEHEESLGIRHYDDPGRLEDNGEDWTSRHHNAYYRNDYEDPGSTSVILGSSSSTREGRWGPETHYTPENFQTHRDAVTQALQFGKHVPHHVRAVYEATGGASGPKAVAHTDYQPRNRQSSLRRMEDPLPTLDQSFVRAQKVYGPQPGSKFVPLKHGEPEHDYGGYGSAPGN